MVKECSAGVEDGSLRVKAPCKRKATVKIKKNATSDSTRDTDLMNIALKTMCYHIIIEYCIYREKKSILFNFQQRYNLEICKPNKFFIFV